MLSEHAGNLMNIEVLNLDVNNITALCPAVRNWTKLKTFSISDNSLTGETPSVAVERLLMSFALKVCLLKPQAGRKFKS